MPRPPSIELCGEVIERALREDLKQAGDITTNAVVAADIRGVARIVARERLVLNQRLVSLLSSARERVEALKTSLESHNQLELLALDARSVLALYEEATGRRYQEDLLDVIFSRFCIGK